MTRYPDPRLRIDFETFSDVDLRDTTVYRYVDSPDFEIMFAWWGYSKDDIRLALGIEEILAIPGLFDPDIVKVAHNAAFERVCLSAASGLPVGEYLAPEDWHDTAAVAVEKGYPRSLDELAIALGGERKDTAGTRLINLFCKPDRNGRRIGPKDRPEDWERFLAYGRQDVRTLFDVDEALGDFPTEDERDTYLADQRINDRGIAVDLDLASAAVEAAEDNRMVQELEIMRISGVSNPGSQPQMLSWLRERGMKITDLQAATVERLLERDLDPDVRRVLELRQELALVAAKKFTAAINGANSDGRLRGQFLFFGAHTGRWAGRGVQLHNLPRASIKLDPETEAGIRAKGLKPKEEAAAIESALAAKTEAAILDLKLGAGADASTLKALVRPMLVGPFTVADYSAIEARVVAWLAGEEWVLEAFRQGRDIYVETAGRMTTESHAYTRSDGKIAVLALGYNGAVNSLRAMGATGSDDELAVIVRAWREANPEIVRLWRKLGDAFYRGGPAGDLLVVEKDGDDRRIVLPSGRAIVYHRCRFEWVEGRFGKTLSMSFSDPKLRGAYTRTYGGRLVENVTQAVARDILAGALVRADKLGIKIVGHIHDEVVHEFVSVGKFEGHSIISLRSLMTAPFAWSKGLPIDAAGFTADRYKKG